MKLCIVTGGSGGHIFPALTYADYAKSQGHDIVFIGNDHKMEARIIPEAGYPFYAIHNDGLQGSVLDKLKAVFSQFKAIREAEKHLKAIQPDLVLVFGGYVSAPVSYAAHRLNIPIIIHEQNAFPGKANKMVAKYAKAIITCYPESFKDDKRSHYLGNPQASLALHSVKDLSILKTMNLAEDKPIVLCMMGSQGSTAMNKKFLELINVFDRQDIQLIITTGPTNYDAFMKEIHQELPSNIHIEAFVNAQALMPHLSLLVCRAGASTIAEIQAFGLASLLIPSPYVANLHQHYNAQSMKDRGACEMVEEKDLNGPVFRDLIASLVDDKERLKSLGERAQALAMPDAVVKIHELVMNLGEV